MEENPNTENQNTNTVENANVEGTGNVDTQTTNQNEGQAEKTFTQEELNKIAQERLDKEKKKMPSKDELKAFRDWQESQKTAEQKQAEKEAEYQKTLNELNTLKQSNAVLSAGVNKDDADYVLFKVSKMEGEFDENLAKFLKDNPKYLKQELEARGIVVLDNNDQNSPYVSKIDLEFISYGATQDAIGLHSKLVGVLQVSDINKNKKFTIRTKQDVQGFDDLKETTFYTHLLIKQMANKAASLISEL